MVMARRGRRRGKRPGGRRAPEAPLDQALFQWALGNEDSGIVTTDERMIVRHWNAWMTAHTGRRAEDAVGRPLFDLYPGSAARLGIWYRGALAGQVFILSQRIHGHLFPIPRAGGKGALMPQSGRIAPLRLGDKIVGTITVVRDVSERLDREEELRRLNSELEATVADRTRALGLTTRELDVMMYTVAHDLRAPLRTIRSFSQLVLRDAGISADSRSLLDRVEAATIRLSRLIDEILDAARLMQRPLRDDVCDLSSIAKSVLDDLASGEPGRAVDARVAPHLAVRGDSELLRRVLENLLGNAWKFTSRTPDARIEFGVRTNKELVFYVRDNGAGFDMAHAAQLFGLFSRLHREQDFGGSGIGLAIVQRVIERHGGRVWAEGAVGQGASFYFTLPLSSKLSR